MQLLHFIILPKKCGRYFAALFILFYFSHCKLVATQFSETHPLKDSLKNKYKLNDPRNPNCPCHLHQKKADKEFNKQIKKIKKNKIKSEVRKSLFYRKFKSKKVNIKRVTKPWKPRIKGLFKKGIVDCQSF